jgi:hypothetical protein
MKGESIYDCFISHASEDKRGFVHPLALEMRRLSVRVWYDKFALKVGDSLSKSIDEGLAKSRFGIVILSKAFLGKAWPEYELRGLIAREVGSQKLILPVWLGISKSDLLQFSPPLADKVAIIANRMGINDIARQLIEIVRPDIAEHIHRMEVLQERLRSAPIERTPVSKIKMEALFVTNI